MKISEMSEINSEMTKTNVTDFWLSRFDRQILFGGKIDGVPPFRLANGEGTLEFGVGVTMYSGAYPAGTDFAAEIAAIVRHIARHVRKLPEHYGHNDDGKILRLKHGTFRLEELSGGQLFFQVLEMDEAFGAISSTVLTFKSKQSYNQAEWEVLSYGSPGIALAWRKIHLRASLSGDDFKATILPDCLPTHRDDIIAVLEDWDQNWKGWPKEPELGISKYLVEGTLAIGGRWRRIEK
jgi:hypothetical protein